MVEYRDVVSVIDNPPEDPFMGGWEAACAGKQRTAPDAKTAAAWLEGYDSVPPEVNPASPLMDQHSDTVAPQE